MTCEANQSFSIDAIKTQTAAIVRIFFNTMIFVFLHIFPFFSKRVGNWVFLQIQPKNATPKIDWSIIRVKMSLWNCLQIYKSLSSKENVVDFAILPNAQILTVPGIVDQFGHKRGQKKRKDIDYKLL